MAPQIVEYAIPTASSMPTSITQGPDGNLWFTEPGANKVADITPAGSITEFPVNGSNAGIVTGVDGALWFGTGNGTIGRITTAGAVHYFAFPGAAGAMTRGPVGNGSIWFTAGSSVDAMATNGAITAFPLPAPAPTPSSEIRVFHLEFGIAAGPDGNLWFTSQGAGCSIIGGDFGCHHGTSFDPAIERMTLSGKVTKFASPNFADKITAGPDGNLWFTEFGTDRIGRITTAGKITEFPVPTQSSAPTGLTSGPDGNVWFTENSANQLGRITMSGAVTEFPIPTRDSGPIDITAGPDGTLWFTESNANKIGSVKP
jgi:virginiamycin B lyase